MYNALNHRNFSLNIPTPLTVLDPGNALVSGYARVTSGSSSLNSHQFQRRQSYHPVGREIHLVDID
jgi:hypothetical protein